MFDELERRRGEVERHRENFARLAFAFGRFESTGIGTYEFEDRVQFGVTFIEEPFMSYGSYCEVDDLRDLLDIADAEDCPLPHMTGTVTAWDQDDRDFYIGAWVAVTVSFPDATVPVDTQPVCQHHFTFSATAIKDVPADVRD